MSVKPVVRVFISSPGDTSTERALARSVITRLALRYRSHFELEAVLWEDTPLLASQGFQAQIVRPSDTDIVVVILWWRLGTLLPPQQHAGALSSGAVTGTEWEFEDAFAAYVQRGTPALLIYRKLGAPALPWGETGAQTREQAQQISQQQDRLEKFVQTWLADERLKQAHRTFNTGAEYEDMLERHLDRLLAQRLQSPQTLQRRWIQGNPYRGLQPFEAEHAAVFFGRTRARNELREALAAQTQAGTPFVLVVGASGSGKSSLAKAGLLADLQTPGMIGQVAALRSAVFQPALAQGPLLQALAGTLLRALPELASQHLDVAALLHLLATPTAAELLKPPLATALAAAQAAHQPPLSAQALVRVLLVVDQLEELFTHGAMGAEERQAFAAALRALVDTGLVWVVATLRIDFLDALGAVPALAGLARGHGLFLLQPPDSAELGQIIRGPAEEAGVRFEVHTQTGIGLDETIRMAAADSAAALPLLGFLLAQLWERSAQGGMLSYAAYDALGGFAGAIGRRAEEVFGSLDDTTQQALPALLRALASVDAGAGTRFTARAIEMPQQPLAHVLVQRLIDARLLVVATEGDAPSRVRFAHEALLAHWTRARQSLERDAVDLRLRTFLETREAQWRESPTEHRHQRLLSGLDLADAQGLVARHRDELPTALTTYVSHSAASSRRQRLRRRGMQVAGAAGALVAAGAVWLSTLDDWGRYALFTRFRQTLTGPLVPKLQTIPAGHFMMGDARSEKRRADEKPEHRVDFAKPFQIGAKEVTHREFGDYLVSVAAWPNAPKLLVDAAVIDSIRDAPDTAVVKISWLQVQGYLQWLQAQTGQAYRLPSEAEWEYAARGNQPPDAPRRLYSWGDEVGVNATRCSDCPEDRKTEEISKPPRAGEFAPNSFGLYDMHGGVWEMLADCYVGSYEGAPTDGSARVPPFCPDGYVRRGGSWRDPKEDLTLTVRDAIGPATTSAYYGFRIALSP